MPEEIKKDTTPKTTAPKTTAKPKVASKPKVEETVAAPAIGEDVLREMMEQLAIFRELGESLKKENDALKTELAVAKTAPAPVINVTADLPEERKIRVYCMRSGFNVLHTSDGRKPFRYYEKGTFHRMKRDDFDEVIAAQIQAFKNGSFCISRADEKLIEDYPFLQFIGEIPGECSLEDFKKAKKMSREELTIFFSTLSEKGKATFVNDWLAQCSKEPKDGGPDPDCFVGWKLDVFTGTFRNEPQLLAFMESARKVEEGQ